MHYASARRSRSCYCADSLNTYVQQYNHITIMELTVNVKIGLQPETEKFLAGLSTLIEHLNFKAVAKNDPNVKRLIEHLDLQPTEAPQASQSAPVQAPAAEAPSKEYTVEDVRAAIRRTRQRIYGSNVQGQALYKDALTTQFKLIAFSLEKIERPSELKTSEDRRRFCEECDKLEVNARGEIKPKEEF